VQIILSVKVIISLDTGENTMLPNSSFRDRQEYNKRILKEAQEQQRVRLAEEWNRSDKSAAKKAAGQSSSLLLKPVLRLVEFILITLGL
jgi:hypothetical protein